MRDGDRLKRKKRKKFKKNCKLHRKIQFGLSFYPCSHPIPPIKTIYRKNPHKGQLIKTQMKKKKRKTF